MEQQIKSQNVLKVIRNFEKVLPLAKGESALNMQCGVVEVKKNTLPGLPYGHKCGTIHCHAGWYGVSKIEEIRQLLNPEIVYISYIDGLQQLEADLGLKVPIISISMLAAWAMINAEIWGNTSGEQLYSHEYAFTSSSRPAGAKTLQDIVDHWKDVYKRLRNLEEGRDINFEGYYPELEPVQISEPPVTAEEVIDQLQESVTV